MKLQVAIDRVSLEDALEFTEIFHDADIIEIGTSLVKDYGLDALKKIRKKSQNNYLLVDLKTIDEGEYEFRKYFEAGADILTVMGASHEQTIDICYQVAKEYKKKMFVDLLECSESKIKKIGHYSDAIYGIHLSKDAKKVESKIELIEKFYKQFPEIKQVAFAGGVDLETAVELKKTKLDIVIVGSAILKSENPVTALQQFLEAVN